MKALLISDVHGNLPALEAVWKKEGNSDAVYCAGDLVDWGSTPWRPSHGSRSTVSNASGETTTTPS